MELDPRADMKELRPQPGDDLKKLRIGEREGQNTHIGTQMEREVEEAIIKVVVENSDLFAWSTADMHGVDPSVVCHNTGLLAVSILFTIYLLLLYSPCIWVRVPLYSCYIHLCLVKKKLLQVSDFVSIMFIL